MKGNLFQKLGIVLIVLSACLLLGTRFLESRDAAAAEELAMQMEERLTCLREGDPNDYSDSAMPVLQLEGEDFSALIQVPAFGVSLPVGYEWKDGAVRSWPRRFCGSAYDSSLVIGGADAQGQFDFFGRLDLEEKILITDMTGTRFSYRVTRIDRRDHADLETLTEEGNDLTLFVRDQGSLQYILVRCELAP